MERNKHYNLGVNRATGLAPFQKIHEETRSINNPTSQINPKQKNNQQTFRSTKSLIKQP